MPPPRKASAISKTAIVRRHIRIGIIVALVVCATETLVGQGGPPMITDDPGTPGPGRWENNIAFTLEHRPGETLYDTPVLDLNYGVGEHLQLNLQGGPVLLKRSHQGVIGGLGETEVAVKWRFLDEDDNGIDMSVYPRVIFNLAHSSVRRGLTEDGTRFQIQVEAAKKFGCLQTDAEIGPVVSSVGKSEWLYGIVVGVDVAKTTGLMAELHGTSRTNFTRDALVANVGMRHELTHQQFLILSLGHELRSAGKARGLVGYCGMQLLY